MILTLVKEASVLRINTKIILEELDVIKKHLGIKEEKNTIFQDDNKK